ncbi:SRPBCC family protein [uncultured Fibrella sp.]|uniref:SRPBCC family protein n=1 Tax=uncultured Fibrella sp. TaxID=1284596 RepID=UPI0035CADCCC
MAEKQFAMGDLKGMSSIRPYATGSSTVNVGHTERIISAAAGALLTTIGARRGSWLLATVGGYLAFRGASGFCPISQAVGRNTAEDSTVEPLEISRSITINKPRNEVYQYWRKLENLPKFMKHLQSVTQLDDRRSHWVAPVPGTEKIESIGNIEWDAEIVEEVENEKLIWRSVADATVDNAGEVRFQDAPPNRGTEVHVTIRYTPPAGQLGTSVAKLLQPAFRQMVKEDIRRFKRIMETGMIPSNEGPSGREPERINPALRQPTDQPQTQSISPKTDKENALNAII